jgi:hypothetical protein
MRSVILVLTLSAAACVGSLEPIDPGATGDDTPDPTSVARQMFDEDVSPLLRATCAGCHVGTAGTEPLKFLGGTGEPGYYAAITAAPTVNGGWDPAQAELLTKGVHSTARAWTTAESDVIAMWLLAEADER